MGEVNLSGAHTTTVLDHMTLLDDAPAEETVSKTREKRRREQITSNSSLTPKFVFLDLEPE